MADLAAEAGITVQPMTRMLGEFASVVLTLAVELLEPLPRVLAWRVEADHRGGVTLVVVYAMRDIEPQTGTVTWTPVGILNDGARAAVRQVRMVAEAIGRAGGALDELAPGAG